MNMRKLMAVVAVAASAAIPISANTQKAMTAAREAIQEGHGYTPKGYVQPKEPEVRERLEWFKDQKLALMMCLGLYSTIGIKESWPLCDKNAQSKRREVTWTNDPDEFKRQYYGLIRSFNPVRFEPAKWAKAAKENGFRYLIFTTKQHDGFCLYDSKYTSFKVTAPECPFSADPRADIVRHVFNAFRAEGLGIAAYFSKPDWYNEDYWEGHGIGRYTTPYPTYDVKKNPAKWARFREFTKNQLLELVRDYGPIDILWLDGGQVQRRSGLDIRIEEIIAEARKVNHALISVDRANRGPCENVITPEQTVPKSPIAVPWESCITIGKWWGYHFEDEYKSVRQIVHTLIDVVAKGGNLALNVGPQPDGRLPHQALERMAVLGAWLKVNGEAIYETRPLAPYRTGDWAFTRNRKTGREFAIRLWNDGEKRGGRQVVPVRNPSEVKSVTHLASGRKVPFERTEKGLVFVLSDDFPFDANADVFVFGRIAGSATQAIRIHSHNDYAQKRPFWGAYEAGADSIEADVFLVDGELLVAHSRKELKKENTLRHLYLEPLREVMRKNGGRARANGKPLQLVIDLKSGKPALDALLTVIEQEGFRECFDTGKNTSAVKLSVGGNISNITDFLAYPDFVFFSVPSSRKLDDGQYKRVSWISDHARIYTKWRSGAMTEADKEKIRAAARRAHAKGVPYRLWGFPDHAEAWRLIRELGLDYINTDHPDAVAAFLASPRTDPADLPHSDL